MSVNCFPTFAQMPPALIELYYMSVSVIKVIITMKLQKSVMVSYTNKLTEKYIMKVLSY